VRIQYKTVFLVGTIALFILAVSAIRSSELPPHMVVRVGTFPGSQPSARITLSDYDPNRQWIVANYDCGVSDGYLVIGETKLSPNTKTVLRTKELEGVTVYTSKVNEGTQTSCAEMVLVEYSNEWADYSPSTLYGKLKRKP
jgi:hypothetical protein